MYKKIEPMFFLVKTPLHMGSGIELGIVDQPIQREQHTSYPKLEASGIKGTIRHEFVKGTNSDLTNSEIEVIFGPEEVKEDNDRASCLSITDGRILFFPIKSVKNVFTWITCPAILSRFKRDMALCTINLNLPEIPLEKHLIPHNSELIISNNTIILEEYAFKNIKKDQNDGKLTQLMNWVAQNIIPKEPEYEYIRKKIIKDTVILSDDDFRDFVNISTEVITRTKINPETGIVERGALFTEEYLPSESILYSLMMTSPIFKAKSNNVNYGKFSDILNSNDDETQAMEIMKYFKEKLPKIIQMGGNATIGKGLISINIIQNTNKGNKQDD